MDRHQHRRSDADDVAHLDAQYPGFPRSALVQALHMCGGLREASQALGTMHRADVMAWTAVHQPVRPLAPQEEALVDAYVTATGCGREQASTALAGNGWDLDAALNEGGMVELFETLKKVGIEEGGECARDEVQGAGLVRLCDLLCIKAFGDPAILVIAWLLNCRTPYTITRAEFVSGFDRLGCTSLSDVKNRLEGWCEAAWTDRHFPAFYGFVFVWSRQERCLDRESSVELWRLLLTGRREWPLLDEWVAFLEKVNHASVSKDLWQQLLAFASQHGGDLSGYDENGPWPCVVDSFVQYAKHGALPDHHSLV